MEPLGADGNRNVVVHLEQAKRRTLELGASYSTSDGAGLDAQWTRRNILHRADPLTLALSLAEKDQKLSVSLLRPHAIGRGVDLRYSVELEREDITAYERVGAKLLIATEAQTTARRALTYGVSLSADDYGRQTAGVSSAYVVSAFANGKLDYSDRRFDPTEGSVLEARVEPAVSTGDATTAFVRMTGDARGYYSPSGRVTFAARVGAGWVAPLSGKADDLPLDRRFYAGGGGSVRGYAYKSIYPLSNIADPPGGQGLLETALEARFRTRGPFGAAAFVEGGSAFNKDSELDMRWGAGVGLRYDLGFAPIRLDIATPLNKRPNDNSYSIYVSLGQAF
jgi:translocation and assembly module TamA